MTARAFLLLPFSSDGNPPDIRITGLVKKQGDRLFVDYLMQGRLESVSLPARSEAPSRRHGLWTETCCELFLAREDAETYWEFNFSPTGHWNAYRFTRYREGMEEEPAMDSLNVTSRHQTDAYILSVSFRLDRLVPPGETVSLGLSAVTRSPSGETNYWALAHNGAEPDFHRKDGFIVRI